VARGERWPATAFFNRVVEESECRGLRLCQAGKSSLQQFRYFCLILGIPRHDVLFSFFPQK